MLDDTKATVDQLVNSLLTITLLSTQLRRDLGVSAQRAVELEATANKAVRTIKGCRQRSRGKHSLIGIDEAN